MLPTLRIRLFGRCSFESEASAIQDLNCAKARELLGYLACHRDRHLARELVIGTLWGEMQEEQGKRALRQTLWHLQTALGPFQITANRPFIEADGEWIRLNPTSAIWMDLIRFEELEKLTRFDPQQPIVSGHTHNLKEAVAIYRGPLMEDCFKDWCVRQRDLLHKQYLRMLLRLMHSQRESGDYDGAMATALSVLREEPASEKAHWMVMWLYNREGDRTSALRQYEHYKMIVHNEFNARPSKLMVDLNNKIRMELELEIVNEPESESSRTSVFEERVIKLLEDIREEMIRNRLDSE